MIRPLVLLNWLSAPLLHAQGVPPAVLGHWRVDHVLTAKNSCWDGDRAQSLTGTTLVYGPGSLRWQGGEVPLQGVLAVTRTLSRKSFAKEYGLDFDSLGIHTAAVTEVDLQHEDADVTGGSTEVPGDTVLLAGAGRLIVSVCGVWYEAVRARR